MNTKFRDAHGVSFLMPTNYLPKRTVGKRFGVTAFITAWLPILWLAAVFFLTFLDSTLPSWTGIPVLVRVFWYAGMVLTPLLAIPSLIFVAIALLRPATSGRIWAIFAIVLLLTTVGAFFVGYFQLLPEAVQDL